MADVAEATSTPAQLAAETPEEAPAEVSAPITFGGTTRNLVPGMAMLLAGVLAFYMGMTDVFFAEATAWVFIIWGALLIYAGLIDINETFEVTDEAFVIRNVMRPWRSRKVWDWDHISRLEIVVRKKDARLSRAKMQIYYTPEGELGIERQDRSYDPRMAELIVERAGLAPASADNPHAMDAVPLEQNAVYIWQ